MKKIKAHLIFWLAFYAMAFISDYTFDKKAASQPLHISFFVLRNVVMFYTCYIALYISIKNFKNKILSRIIALILSIVISFLSILVYREIKFLLIHEPYKPLSNYSVFFSIFLVWYSNSVIYAFLFYFFERNIHKQKELLEAQKREFNSNAAFLRAQINPHFLQNTLNYFYASALTGKSKELAEGILLLSDIMKYSLAKQEITGMVSLEKEVNFIHSYIKINQLRFNNRLCIQFNTPTSLEIDGLKVLPLVMITLVENAFKHGELERKDCPVQMSLSVDDNEEVVFKVKNSIRNGPKENSGGIGLQNTINRLKDAYGNNYSLTIDNNKLTYEVIFQFPGKLVR